MLHTVPEQRDINIYISIVFGIMFTCSTIKIIYVLFLFNHEK